MQERSFDKAVANMAVMDIADIGPLLHGIYDLLKSGGVFVFSTHHPSFMKPEGKYKTACIHEGESIRGQPVLQLYYHRSLQDILHRCFDAGFVMNGFYEEYDDDPEMPVIIIVRLKKLSGLESRKPVDSCFAEIVSAGSCRPRYSGCSRI